MARKTPHHLSQEITDLVQRYRQVLERSGIPVQAIAVFGSHAKGTPKPWSDVDVAVVSPAFGRNYHEESVRLMRLRRSVSTLIEPHPFHPDDLNDYWNTLAAEVRQHGISFD